jgi:hypothetical protein
LTNTYHWPYQNIGVVVRKGDVELRAELWVRVLRAFGGIRRWYDDPKLAKGPHQVRQGRDPDSLQKTYDFFTRQAGFNKELVPTDQGIQHILNFVGSTTLPAAKDALPARFYDPRILELKK